MPKWSRRGRSREITPGAASLGEKYRIRSNEYLRDVGSSREDNKSCKTQRWRIYSRRKNVYRENDLRDVHVGRKF